MPRPRFHWLVFFAQLFIPTIATIAVVQLPWPDAAPFIALFGGIGSGLIGGIMLGLWLGRSSATRLWLSMIFIVVLGVACIGMNCFGCLASGYSLNFH